MLITTNRKKVMPMAYIKVLNTEVEEILSVVGDYNFKTNTLTVLYKSDNPVIDDAIIDFIDANITDDIATESTIILVDTLLGTKYEAFNEISIQQLSPGKIDFTKYKRL
jgi:hypothetical protein